MISHNKILVTGPESSGTRMVARLIADNLGIIESARTWDGHDIAENGEKQVIHRSLPHGAKTRGYFPRPWEFGQEDEVFTILCIRDPNIAAKSAAERHNKGDLDQAKRNLTMASQVINEILISSYKSAFFHYESAILLKNRYINWWTVKHLDVINKSKLEIFNGNKSYIKEDPDVKTD